MTDGVRLILMRECQGCDQQITLEYPIGQHSDINLAEIMMHKVCVAHKANHCDATDEAD